MSASEHVAVRLNSTRRLPGRLGSYFQQTLRSRGLDISATARIGITGLVARRRGSVHQPFHFLGQSPGEDIVESNPPFKSDYLWYP